MTTDPSRPTEPQGEVKRRTITLTARPPVSILESEWPVIAKAHGTDYSGRPDLERLAEMEGDCEVYDLRVRSHADGRALVYGTRQARNGRGPGAKGGELLRPGADVADALARVARDLGIPDAVTRVAVADLPAEEL